MDYLKIRDKKMRINNIKINGMTNPIGYDFDSISITYAVTDFSNEEAKKLGSVFEVIISDKKDFSKVLFSQVSDVPKKIEINLKLSPRTRYYVGISIDGNEVKDSAWFETGKCNEPWSAKWIATEEADSFHPIFRRQYYSSEEIKKARLYICGLGLYEAYINGNRVGDEYLSPGIYDYSEELQYQTYDVTEYVGRTNDIQVLLGKGWYMGRFGLEGKDKLFGDRFQMIAELHIELVSGKKVVIGTDEEYSYYGSDIEESGIYDGEIYNHCLYNKRENKEKNAVLINEKRPLIARVGVPVVEKDLVYVKEIIHTAKGETVLDFGQNMAGYVSFKSCLPEGARITLKFGEVLQNGNFYNDNYRTAVSRFEYVSGGFEEEVWPHFSFFGFRYVCVEGFIGDINPDDFTAHVIYSDLDRTGYFNCSNEKVNRLYENAFWGQRSNFIDMPTDCPQRDERMGWTGDAQVFASAASYNMDTRPFFQKYLHDLRNEQKRMSGGIPNYIPSKGTLAGCSFVWGDAGTFIPDTLSKMYDNKSNYKTNYELMKDWCEYCLRTHMKDDYLVHGAFGFGDWLALDGVTEQSMRGGTNDDYISSVYLCESLRKTSQMAELLGLSEDCKKYSELSGKIKAAILNEYFTAIGHLCIDTQAAYLIALRFGIYRDINVLKADLKNRFKRDGYRIRCGFVGAPVLCQILAENGMEKEAYHFLLNEDFPGWLHEVNLGATTIWERWNSLNEDGSISGTGMNSLNHYAYGTVVEFLYSYVCGIKPVEAGFKKAMIKPLINGHLKYAEASYDSIYGKYSCKWSLSEDGKISVHVEIPYGCTAKLVLPERKDELLCGGVYDFNYSVKKNLLKIYDGDSFLGEVVKNEKAASILGEYAPQALFLGNGDVEGKSTKLGELPYMFYLGVDTSKALEALNKISNIIAQ